MDDLTQYLRFLASLALVLGLLLGGAWWLRRSGLVTAAQRPRGRDRRLAITEILPIDPRRRLLLVRRDEVEHLILIGGANDLLIESGISPLRSDGTADGESANPR